MRRYRYEIDNVRAHLRSLWAVIAIQAVVIAGLWFGRDRSVRRRRYPDRRSCVGDGSQSPSTRISSRKPSVGTGGSASIATTRSKPSSPRTIRSVSSSCLLVRFIFDFVGFWFRGPRSSEFLLPIKIVTSPSALTTAEPSGLVPMGSLSIRQCSQDGVEHRIEVLAHILGQEAQHQVAGFLQ